MFLWHILLFCHGYSFSRFWRETRAALSPLEALNHEVHRPAGVQVLFPPHYLATLVEMFHKFFPQFIHKIHWSVTKHRSLSKNRAFYITIILLQYYNNINTILQYYYNIILQYYNIIAYYNKLEKLYFLWKYIVKAERLLKLGYKAKRSTTLAISQK